MENILDEGELGNYKEKDFSFYRGFHNKENAIDYVRLLKSNDIPYRLEGADTLIDEAIVGTAMFPKIILKLVPDDFKTVNDLIEQEVLSNFHDIESHQLNDLSDRELLDILKHQDEWSIENVIITKRLLSIRGIPIPDNHVEQWKQERLEVLQKGRKGDVWTMLSIMIPLIVGSVIIHPFLMVGLVGTGWYYWQDKSVDMDGNKYFTFEKNTRTFGLIVSIISIVIVIASIWWTFNYFERIDRPKEEVGF